MKQLYEQLVYAANTVAFVALFVPLPVWLVIPAGVVCFADFVRSKW